MLMHMSRLDFLKTVAKQTGAFLRKIQQNKADVKDFSGSESMRIFSISHFFVDDKR